MFHPDAATLTFKRKSRSYLFCMLIYALFLQAGRGGQNSFIQEVYNKSLAINDNGVCACVCHLPQSNSGGVSSDLFVY